jgi:multidrug efflux pump subunit AcrB
VNALLRAFARNTVFANIAIVLMLAVGWLAADLMPVENMPVVASDTIVVLVQYPGASPLEVEEGVCRKLEEAVRGVHGIKEMTAVAEDEAGSLRIEVEHDQDPSIVLDDVRSKVNAISEFPKATEKPVITHELFTQPVMLVSLKADMDERRLKEWSLRIRDEIRNLPGISQADLVGMRDYEIHVEIPRQTLERYDLSLSQVAEAIRRDNLNLDAGTLRTQNEDIRVRTVGRRYTGKELASTVIKAGPDGEKIPLEAIAAIKDEFTDEPFELGVDGNKASLVIIYKTKKQNELDISDRVRDYLKQLESHLPPGASVSILYDFSDSTRSRLGILLSNGISGLAIVFGLLWLFTDIRLAFWAGMGIPVSLAGTLGILWASGGTLNMVSCTGMILVMGIIVDDAIVVGESIFTRRLRMGDRPGAGLDAATQGANEVSFPILAAVSTTIAAFVPLFFIRGTMGKYIEILPTVVIGALVVSLLESFFLLPAHLSHLPPSTDNEMRSPTGSAGHPIVYSFLKLLGTIKGFFATGMDRFIHRTYSRLLHWSIRWRYVTLCSAIAFLLASLGLVTGGFVKFEVFPPIDGFVVSASVRFPDGTPADVTRRALTNIDKALLHLNATMQTTSGTPMLVRRIHVLGQEVNTNIFMPSRGYVQAILIPSSQRGIHTRKILAAWEKEIGTIPGAVSLNLAGQEAEEADEKPVSVWLSGKSISSLKAAADLVLAQLKQFRGVYQASTDFMPGKQEYRLSLKPDARALGLTQEDLALQVRAKLEGEEALRLQRGRENIKIKVRATQEERQQLTLLEHIRIHTPRGGFVPLAAVADVVQVPGASTITRVDGKRRIAVGADIDPEHANAYEISRALEDYIPKIRAQYPDVTVSLQGEERKHREPFESLLYGFPLAILGIYVLIATIFRSYAQPFIIMFTVPLGIIGAILGHMVTGHNLSMFSVFGMVALSGVIVNDAIVLIESFNAQMAQGNSLSQAIVNAGRLRFRAVFLTTASTVGGLVPLISETSLEAQTMIPMALSLAGGEVVSTCLILLVIPALLHILNDLRLLVHNAFSSHPRSREELEPAMSRGNAQKNSSEKSIVMG